VRKMDEKLVVFVDFSGSMLYGKEFDVTVRLLNEVVARTDAKKIYVYICGYKKAKLLTKAELEELLKWNIGMGFNFSFRKEIDMEQGTMFAPNRDHDIAKIVKNNFPKKELAKSKAVVITDLDGYRERLQTVDILYDHIEFNGIKWLVVNSDTARFFWEILEKPRKEKPKKKSKPQPIKPTLVK